MKKYILYNPIFAFLLASCATEEYFSDNTPIKLVAQAEAPITRSGTGIQSRAFENGAKINAYITNATNSSVVGKSPIVYTVTGESNNINTLSPDEQPYYPSGDDKVDICAFYPNDVTNTTSSFTVRDDQTENSNYKASDLMFASAMGQVKIDRAINLTFAHKMAKFIINASGEEGVVITGITLKDVYRTIGLTAGTGVLTSALSNKGDITLSNNGAVLLPPQEHSGTLLSVSTNYGTASFSLAASRSFESGSEYTMNLTVTRQQINYTSTITDWNTDIGTMVVIQQATGGLQMADVTGTFKYKNAEWTPEPAVTYENATLTKDADFTYQYFANKDVGTATIVAIGKKNDTTNKDYSGQAAIKTFIIQQETGVLSYAQSSIEQVFTLGETVSNPLTKTGDGTMTYTSSNTSVATIDNETGEVMMQGIGTTTIKASMAGDKNYTKAEASYVLTTTKKPVSSLTITLKNGTSYTYTGNNITPAITVKDGETTLVRDVDYSVGYSNNLDVTTNAKITITGYGDYTGTTDKTFTITQATTTIQVDVSDITINSGSVIVRQGETNFGTITYSSSAPTIATVGTSGSVMGVGNGTATITLSVEGNSNYSSASRSYKVKVISMETVFAFTGNIQTYTVPESGKYKLEVWGGAGGDYKGVRTTSGGGGGYAVGTVSLTAGTILYIVVGGAGGTSTTKNGGEAGYNGGGAGGSGSGNSSGWWSWGGSGKRNGGGGGGGATHIAKVSGLLSSLSGQTSNIYIVAGGGGGAGEGAKGGTGGGSQGSQGIANASTVAEGTQSGGYQFGNGQAGASSTSLSGSGGGGAGYYGGCANTSSSSNGSGGGGSGYTGGVSNGSMTNGQCSGAGRAKITYLP